MSHIQYGYLTNELVAPVETNIIAIGITADVIYEEVNKFNLCSFPVKKVIEFEIPMLFIGKNRS